MPTRPEVLHGPESLDDAGVIRVGDTALVQTVDFFPPIVDDPRDFGRIAAANALSDVYAMGGTPLSVLNIVGFPAKTLDLEILGEILAGGSEKIAEAGAALLGGHSVEDQEVKYGLSVTGIVDPDRILTNGRAAPGDRLVLSKPIGMGAVTTSLQKDIAVDAQVAAAVETMATLNAGGLKAIQEIELGLDSPAVRSATDVTGFGLVGHATEMARASKTTIRLDLGSIPITLGAEDLAAKKCLSGGAGRNRAYLGDAVVVSPDASSARVDLAFDSETSGGLLIAVAPAHADRLIEALEKHGTPCAAIVGEVLAERPGVAIELT